MMEEMRIPLGLQLADGGNCLQQKASRCISGTSLLSGQVKSQPVPEDDVWTIPRAVFWEGQQMASLPCVFLGEPLDVFWKKGESFQTAEDVVVWHNDQKSGGKFYDGSADILPSQNYSLVFKQPVDFDIAGKYFCRVTNHKAEVHLNSTIVTVREFHVQTTPRLTIWKGETALLPCGLPYTPYKVQWVNASSGEVVASYTNGTFLSPSHKSGKFSMDFDFTLAMWDVNVADETTLTCKAFAYDSKSRRNSTILTVNGVIKSSLSYDVATGAGGRPRASCRSRGYGVCVDVDQSGPASDDSVSLLAAVTVSPSSGWSRTQLVEVRLSQLVALWLPQLVVMRLSQLVAMRLSQLVAKRLSQLVAIYRCGVISALAPARRVAVCPRRCRPVPRPPIPLSSRNTLASECHRFNSSLAFSPTAF
ncbi:uncharacterized protein [Diadema antillarum]|uniref:uncharacterized protein n=1 Tax=Diadema antillarum TaxID=105358 RepID=UPI003A8508A4